METRKIWTQFLPQWVLANMLGCAIYASVIAILFFPVHQYPARGVGVGVGFFIGYFQWLVLKKHMYMDSMWLWTSALTYGPYFIVASLFVQKGDSILNAILINILALGILGWIQRSVLNYYVDEGYIWVIVNPIAGTLGFVPAFLSVTYSHSTDPSLFVIWSSYGIIYGIITGVTLALLYIHTINVSRSRIKP